MDDRELRADMHNRRRVYMRIPKVPIGTFSMEVDAMSCCNREMNNLPPPFSEHAGAISCR